MMDILIRNLDEATIVRLDELAKSDGMSREKWLIKKLSEIAQGEIMQPKFGQGLKGFSKNGGQFTLRNMESTIAANAREMTQEEYTAYERAKLVADPKNGGDWTKARKILEDAGFDVFNV